MEKVVIWRIFPGCGKGLGLCSEGRLGQQYSFLYFKLDSELLVVLLAKLTGLLVVPEVYSIMPPSPSIGPLRVTLLCATPPIFFSSLTYFGFASKSCFRTSSALLANFADDKSIEAWLWSIMYCNSLAGKAGERGSAIEFAPRMDSSVTKTTISYASSFLGQYTLRTYIVIAIFYKKSYPLTTDSASPSFLDQPIPPLCHILQKLAIFEPSARRRVHDDRGLGVMICDGFEDG